MRYHHCCPASKIITLDVVRPQVREVNMIFVLLIISVFIFIYALIAMLLGMAIAYEGKAPVVRVAPECRTVQTQAEQIALDIYQLPAQKASAYYIVR